MKARGRSSAGEPFRAFIAAGNASTELTPAVVLALCSGYAFAATDADRAPKELEAANVLLLYAAHFDSLGLKFGEDVTDAAAGLAPYLSICLSVVTKLVDDAQRRDIVLTSGLLVERWLDAFDRELNPGAASRSK